MVKELVVISGKGGTGKTSLMASLATLAQNKVMCDADVDAADLHLLMAPRIKETHDFQGGGIAMHHPDLCTSCGICRDVCKWDAIREDFSIDEIACEGCGVCHYLCPEKAISFPPKICGQWFVSESNYGPMVHARLGVAEENSGKLVTQVRKAAREVAEAKGLDLIITDGPPGVGCPVIASISGATSVLIVSEPSVSGLHDMERVLKLCEHFKIPRMVCINKSDLNENLASAIEAEAHRMNARVVGKIPFDSAFTRAMVQGKSLFEYDETSDTAAVVRSLWKDVSQTIGEIKVDKNALSGGIINNQ